MKVKYSNWMNTLHFADFGATDYNFFITLCARMRDQGTDEVTFSFEEIRKLSQYKSNSNNNLVEDIKKMNRKLLSVQAEITQGAEDTQFVLFIKFKTNRENNTLTVKVNEEFRFVLNDLVRCFTVFDLQDFVKLKSKYSKSLFRLLSQYRTTGVFAAKLDDFRRVMDVPATYEAKQITRYIIIPAVEELSGMFPGLRYELRRDHARGRRINGVVFSFAPVLTAEEQRGSKPKPAKPHKKRAEKPKVDPKGFHNFAGRGWSSYENDIRRLQTQ